jgi:hypothetical protein
MLDKLVIVDYYNGAGGEFFASFINAHWGQPLEWDHQRNPNHLQKWFNSQSLIKSDWETKFEFYITLFLEQCNQQNIKTIAVPYHLHKWPMHQKLFDTICQNSIFVKIDSQGYEKEIAADFAIKVENRLIEDFTELVFYIKNLPRAEQIKYIQKFKHSTVTVKDLNLYGTGTKVSKSLIEHQVIVKYADFFNNFDQTPKAYLELCDKLKLDYSSDLLQKVIERNQQNLHQRKNYLSSV